ncbi:MAG: glycosyltransferase family 61 protein [Pirellulales bacterium]
MQASNRIWYLVDHQAAYQMAALKLLGIPENKLIQPHYAMNVRADQIVRPSEPGTQAIRAAADTIKQTLRREQQSDFTRGKRIYISRRDADHRKIANEGELEELLTSHGFESRSFERCPFEEQVRLLASAEIIVAVHGAALANTIFAPQGTTVIEICPQRRYNIDCFPRLSHAMGNRHRSILADCTRYRQSMTVNLDDVLRCLDAAEHASSAQAA